MASPFPLMPAPKHCERLPLPLSMFSADNKSSAVYARSTVRSRLAFVCSTAQPPCSCPVRMRNHIGYVIGSVRNCRSARQRVMACRVFRALQTCASPAPVHAHMHTSKRRERLPLAVFLLPSLLQACVWQGVIRLERRGRGGGELSSGSLEQAKAQINYLGRSVRWL
jgi:hypothetical protein